MAYIGNPVQQALTKVTSQSFNGTGSQTVFTLNRAVNTGEELEVFVNNVQQEPGVGKSYTATGTTLTFDAAPASGTGNIYVISRGIAEVTRRLDLEHDPNAALAATTGTFSGDLTVDTNTLYVDSTNNRVGVGTTTPNKTLTVATPQTANTAMEVLRLTGSGAYNSGGSNEAGAGVSFGQYSGTYPDWNLGQISGVRSGASWDGALTFSTNNGTGQSSTTERLRIDSSGNLLVGTTNTDPAFNNVTGQSMASTGQLQVTRDGGTAALFNRKTSDGEIVSFRKDGGTVGIIGTLAGFLTVGTGDTGLLFQSNVDNIQPFNLSTNGDRPNAIDIGDAGNRFKDLYLSGGVNFGATGGAVTSKTLDDYEEGIWYPVLKASTTNPTYTANNAVGYYVKIGNMVFVTWYSSVLNITNSGSGGAQIGNLPFTAASASQEYWLFNYQHGTGIAGTNTSGGYVERNNNNLIFIQQGTVTNSTWAQVNGRYVMVSAAYRTT